MKVDPTPTTSGGELYPADVEVTQLVVDLGFVATLEANVGPTTVSISHMWIDSFESGGSDPSPGPEPVGPTFFGVPSAVLGFGGAPPYLICYPLAGNTGA